MLTDAILREATAEAERFLMSIIPEDGEPHVFSKRFERKMQKLIRRTNHPIRYQVMRVAAAVALAIVTLFGAVMAVSPEARAAVVGWIKETFGIYVQYSNKAAGGNAEEEKVPAAAMDKYHFAQTPIGYQELTVLEDEFGRNYVYINDLGQILQFSYTYDKGNSSIALEVNNYDHLSGFVHECYADIYIARNEGETSCIVWQDSQTNVFFWIFASGDETELVEIAQMVEIIP